MGGGIKKVEVVRAEKSTAGGAAASTSKDCERKTRIKRDQESELDRCWRISVAAQCIETWAVVSNIK